MKFVIQNIVPDVSTSWLKGKPVISAWSHVKVPFWDCTVSPLILEIALAIGLSSCRAVR